MGNAAGPDSVMAVPYGEAMAEPAPFDVPQGRFRTAGVTRCPVGALMQSPERRGSGGRLHPMRFAPPEVAVAHTTTRQGYGACLDKARELAYT